MGILAFKFKLKAYAVLVVGAFLVWLALAITFGSGVAMLFVGFVVGGSIYVYAEFFADEGETSGREEYDASLIEKQKAKRLGSDDPSLIPIDELSKKSHADQATPKLDLETSLIALGQTGRGKSTFAKSVVNRWDHERQGMILHALSDGAGPNEFEQFAESVAPVDAEVIRLSTADPDVRWDPFADFDTEMTEMANIAEGMWDSDESEETGYDDAAKALLTCSLAVTSAKYDDFAYLDDVLTGMDVGEILGRARELPNSAAVVGPLESMSESELNSSYSRLMGKIQNLLLSDLFDESLPTFSLTAYMQRPKDYILIDNIRTDKFARPFWRFFLSTSIDLSMSNPDKQYFVLDELDKLPRIAGLDELASAGRTANAQGVLIAQDIHQFKTVYCDEIFQTIWGNCPNRAVFAPGDSETAEYVLQSLGKDEMTQQTVSGSRLDPESSRSRSREDQYPVTPGRLMRMDVGECLIMSKYGWWLVKTSELSLPEPSAESVIADPDVSEFEEKTAEPPENVEMSEDELDESREKIEKLPE